MMPPRTQKGVPSPPPLVYKMGTVTISPSQCSGNCDEQTGTSVKLGEYGGWSLFKAAALGVFVGRGICHSPDEPLHGEDVLEDTLRSQQCLETRHSDQALCWDFIFHHPPQSQPQHSCPEDGDLSHTRSLQSPRPQPPVVTVATSYEHIICQPLFKKSYICELLDSDIALRGGGECCPPCYR